jgi:hypothetical protein
MNNNSDPYKLGKNLQTVVLIILAILLLTDILFRVSPGLFDSVPASRHSTSAVGYHHQFSDSSWYYIYTVFEDNGDVYQVWWNGTEWNQKKVTNYRAVQKK